MPLVIGEVHAAPEGNLSMKKKGKIWVPDFKFSRTYIVIADSISQGERDVITAAGVPSLFTFSQGAYCKRLSGKEMSRVVHPLTEVPTTIWHVTAEFDSELDQDQNQDPDNQPPKVSWDGEEELEVLDRDVITGEPIVTTAGERIIITGPVMMPVLRIQRVELYPFNPSIILQYCNKVNSEAFYGAPTGTALMKKITSEDFWQDNGDGVQIHYERVDYLIKFKLKEDPDNPGSLQADTWKSRPLNEGTLEADENGDIVEAVDKNGNPITVNLELTGQRLDPGEDPVYLEFNRFGKVNFAPLNLGPY